METSCGAKKRKTLKESFEDVERATFLWFLQECSRGTPISGLILAEKVLQFFVGFMVTHPLMILRLAKDG